MKNKFVVYADGEPIVEHNTIELCDNEIQEFMNIGLDFTYDIRKMNSIGCAVDVQTRE